MHDAAIDYPQTALMPDDHKPKPKPTQKTQPKRGERRRKPDDG